MGVLDGFRAGKTIEKIEEFNDSRMNIVVTKGTVLVGGTPQECYIGVDKSGKPVRLGSDVCLVALDEALARQSNPMTGSSNSDMLKDTSSGI